MGMAKKSVTHMMTATMPMMNRVGQKMIMIGTRRMPIPELKVVFRKPTKKAAIPTASSS